MLNVCIAHYGKPISEQWNTTCHIGSPSVICHPTQLAIPPVARALHSIFLSVWRTGHVPSDWKDGIIVTLYKGKGPKADCSNYRPITLLSIPGKVFAHVLLTRIQLLLDRTRRPHQSGFTAGRSTVDAILALHLLSELHREFDRPLHVAYLDIKAAFDSVEHCGRLCRARESQISSWTS